MVRVKEGGRRGIFIFMFWSWFGVRVGVSELGNCKDGLDLDYEVDNVVVKISVSGY